MTRRYLARKEGRSSRGGDLWVVRDTARGEIPLLRTTDPDEAHDFARRMNATEQARARDVALRQTTLC